MWFSLWVWWLFCFLFFLFFFCLVLLFIFLIVGCWISMVLLGLSGAVLMNVGFFLLWLVWIVLGLLIFRCWLFLLFLIWRYLCCWICLCRGYCLVIFGVTIFFCWWCFWVLLLNCLVGMCVGFIRENCGVTANNFVSFRFDFLFGLYKVKLVLTVRFQDV